MVSYSLTTEPEISFKTTDLYNLEIDYNSGISPDATWRLGILVIFLAGGGDGQGLRKENDLIVWKYLVGIFIILSNVSICSCYLSLSPESRTSVKT